MKPLISIYLSIYTVVSRKRAHGRYTLLCAQTGGVGDICNVAAFYHEEAPIFIYKKILHTNTPAQYKLISI